jgi:hypothetical protein
MPLQKQRRVEARRDWLLHNLEESEGHLLDGHSKRWE